jgi:hypothetical protein
LIGNKWKIKKESQLKAFISEIKELIGIVNRVCLSKHKDYEKLLSRRLKRVHTNDKKGSESSDQSDMEMAATPVKIRKIVT